ncbi:MAG: epoxyqueuosine reductase QueH [Lachnospiraceae bacterium]|nr:epoxyqueuosine reductase QueH [Lachnospiraceae bacterium]
MSEFKTIKNIKGGSRNYSVECENIMKGVDRDNKPRLLLHVCCAPCSSYCLEYLLDYFDITVFFYNPNMDTEVEYHHRANELQRFIKEAGHDVKVIIKSYKPEEFYDEVRGLEDEPEGGARCLKCYELRLRKAAKYAAENSFDYFTTTLSISPHKNASALNEIGEKLGFEYKVKHLPSDFKKKDGFKRSIELSMQYRLYRQNYCGCVYSKEDTTA